MRKVVPGGLEGVALRLGQILGEDGVLVGAMAVAAHGYIRATGDVDFVARLPLGEVRARFQAQGISTTLHRGDPREGDFPCLKGALDGVRFDVLSPLVPLDWKRAIVVSMRASGRLRVVDLEGLIQLKLRAQGPKDLMDVAALVLRHPHQLGRTRETARTYGAADALEVWLKDPRLRAEIKETREAEEARRKPAKPQPPRARRTR